ncbi:hypothetical protein niasHT_020527 [Heterodera trifolii]|uniref:Transmembrane protein n=1 Tax=Heterodera trifolii TaxID=157864 RepID=A0ABD2J9M7_9BILA
MLLLFWHCFVRLPFLGIFPFSPSLFPLPLLLILFHFHCPSSTQSLPPFGHLNPLPDPCHLPTSSSSASLSPFCQFHYHQIPYICDPAGILSRTEAELIDRRLFGVSASFLPNQSVHPLNLTGCFCDGLSSPAPPFPKCFVHSAWKDKKMHQIRIVVLITPRASINSIKKCAKLTGDKNRQKRKSNGEETMAKQRHNRETLSHGFSSATALFVRGTLKRLLNSANARERCDLDLLVLFILGWSGGTVPMPFVARLFRRNLAHLAHHSQLERVDSAEKNAFEVLSDQLVRAVQLIGQTSPIRPSATVSPFPTATSAQLGPQFDPFSVNHRTEQIPLWAILCSMALLSLALVAVLLAHWVGRRISASHQKKGAAHRMANGLARSSETIRRAQEVGGVQKGATGHSVTFATNAAGERERGGAERGGGGGGGHQMKGSMMFRQFSRRHQRTRTDGGTAQQQKI